MVQLRNLWLSSAIIGSALSGPLRRRDTVGSDDIVGLSETVPDTVAGQLYLKYKPYLYRQSGCVPYPAVDADGNTKFVLLFLSPFLVTNM